MTWGSSAAAAAAVALLLAGCASGGAVSESAEPATVADVTASASAVEPVVVEWLSGSRAELDQLRAPQTPVTGAVPGAEISLTAGRCTLGPAVDRGFLTAGHCDKIGDSPVTVTATGEPLGQVADVAFSNLKPVPETGLVLDAAVISATPRRGATMLAGRVPVAGVLTADAVKELETGTLVCAVESQVPETPLRCGPFNSVYAGFAGAPVPGRRGDSGSAAFVISADGRAALFGTVSGPSSHRGISVLEPALKRLGVRVLLDPSAEPFTGPDFSGMVTPAAL